jgi:hypothetical protein
MLISYHFGSNKNFYAHLGPYIGVLLNAKDDSTAEDFGFAFNDFDLGISYALGYKIYLNQNIKLFTEVEISPGLIDVFAVQIDSSGSAVNGRTSFNLGVLFNL